MARPRTLAGAALTVASFGLLAPGLALPALSIEVAPVLPILGRVALHRETRSVLGAIHNLYVTGNILVAGLILLFSVLVPAAKGLSLLGALAARPPVRRKAHAWVAAVSKWSMADVFAAGMWICWLSGRAVDGVRADLHPGFWFFLGYCLVSLAGAQCLADGGPGEGGK